MNKIENQKTDIKNQQRSNYHQQQNAKSRQGSSSVHKRRRQISSIFTNSSSKNKQSKSSYETISNSRSTTSRQSKPKKNSIKQLKSVHGRKKTPIPPKNEKELPCKFWMNGRCKNFEFCRFRHYQMSQISFKQDKIKNKIESINQQLHNQQQILVKIEKTSLMTVEELIQKILKSPDNISTAIKISYQNKKAINKLKNQLNKNQRDPYTNNAQKINQEEKILNELLKNTQSDNKNSNALRIKEKIQKIKQEKEERKQIMRNKPKIIIQKEIEEKQIQNQVKNQNQKEINNQQIVIETDEQSDEEINITQQPKKIFIQSIANQKHNTQLIQQQSRELNNNNFPQITTQQYTQQQKKDNNTPSTSNQELSQLLSKTTSQNPQTQMSSTYIQEKDNIINNSYLDQQTQQDMQWSRNIKSPFQQWKQIRDGKNKQKIDLSSEENTKNSPFYTQNQKKIMEFIEKSKNKQLYDWKLIYDTKAYRNDELQNFISYHNPKLRVLEKIKVFMLAVDFIDDQALLKRYWGFNQQSKKLKEKKQIKDILSIFYNKDLLNKVTENYDPEELSKHFYNASEAPEKSHIHKMAAVINRYIKNLFEEILKSQTKTNENQKISFTEDQYVQNQTAIIEVLRNIILQYNYDPHQINYITNQGLRLVNIFPSWALDWEIIIEDKKKNRRIKQIKIQMINKQQNINIIAIYIV